MKFPPIIGIMVLATESEAERKRSERTDGRPYALNSQISDLAEFSRIINLPQ